MRWIKRIVVGTLSSLVVLVTLALIVPFVIPTSAYKNQIETRIRSAIGRELTLGGELKLTILPNLELVARDVVLGNLPEAAQKDMVKLKELNLKLKLGPLFSGRFEVTALELVEPHIVLEIDKVGKPNWVFEKPAGAPGKPAEHPQESATSFADILARLKVDIVRVVRGHIVYNDGRSGARYELSKANFEVSPLDRPFRIVGDVEYEGKQIGFSAEVKSLFDLMKGQPSDLALGIKTDLAKLSLTGTAETDPKAPKGTQVAGSLKIEVSSVRDLATWLGSPLPAGRIFGPLTLFGTVAYSADAVSLSGLALRLDDIAASGHLAVTLADVPTVRGMLSFPSLNLTPYLTASSPASSTRPASARPLAAPHAGAAPLRGVNADLKIDARKIEAKQFHVDEAALGLKLSGGILAVSLDRVSLYRGSATGTVTINGERTPLSLNPNVQLKGLDGGAVLAALGAGDRLTGTLNVTANLTVSGTDATAIKRSIAGPARVSFTNGALRGYNIAGLFRAIGDIRSPLQIVQQVKTAVEALNRYDPNQKTDFSELSATFRATNGVFATNDLRMAAPLLRVEGRGTVSLPGNSLDMILLAKAVPTFRGQGSEFAKLGIPIPLHARGPFGNIAWTLDEKAFGDEMRKRVPELMKEQILKKPGDILKRPGDIIKKPDDIIKKPGGILDQFRR
jgi:AsmA protein